VQCTFLKLKMRTRERRQGKAIPFLENIKMSSTFPFVERKAEKN
jgi:hypothetical protein